MTLEEVFAFSWHPYAVEQGQDYTSEIPTRVEFRLTPIATGTLLVITESGFENVPPSRRDEAYQMNEGGWTEQMKNIERHVSHGITGNAAS